MKTKQNKFALLLAVLLTSLGIISSCSKDEDPTIDGPKIELTEVGSSNNKEAYIGGDIHLDGRITAEGLIQEIDVEIHQENGSFEIKKTYTEGKYIGTREVDFHEHIEIPNDAPAGDYHLHIHVKDKLGRVGSAEAEIKLVKKSASAALIFTPVTGDAVEAHGDHFHGLGTGVEGTPVVITFDENGNALTNGHLHLDAEIVYKIDLKTYDAQGAETQGKYIANETIANTYKAFLIGGNFILNPNTDNESGAIFQPRELTYGDGTTVTGAAGIGTTGILSYFIIGHKNEGATKDITYVLRKLNPGIKSTITRLDWNRTDYLTVFTGQNELELKFEIHAEHDH